MPFKYRYLTIFLGFACVLPALSVPISRTVRPSTKISTNTLEHKKTLYTSNTQGSLEGYYLGIFGGYISPNKFKQALDDGFSVGGHYGYRDDNYRTEFGFNYMNNQINGVTNGKYRSVMFMLNAYYDFNFRGHVVPFLGAGIGYLNASRNACTNAINNCNVLQPGGKFAYQGIAGLGFNIKNVVRLDFRYRYLAQDHSQNFSQNVFEAVLNFFMPSP